MGSFFRYSISGHIRSCGKRIKEIKINLRWIKALKITLGGKGDSVIIL